MTREEAIALFEKQLTAAQAVLDSGFGSNPGENDFLYRRRKDMAEIALAALRPVSQERVEKAEWIWSTGNVYTCSSCGEKTHVDECMGNPIYNFCPFCMAPMTDEAVQMVMERLETLKDGKE